MLRSTPSLALRAGLIFISIYMFIFVAMLAVAVAASWTNSEGDRHDGARIALSAAAREVRIESESLQLPNDGHFGRLAARNPSLWVIGRQGERTFAFGPVPAAAVGFFEQFRGRIDTARFYIPTAEPPLNVAAIRRYDLGHEDLLVAAGGVDPRSLSPRDYLRGFGAEGVLSVLVAIAALGLLAMLVALPLFSRAISPITAEAVSLGPDDSRRLDERKAPRELLPLVRAFNAVLDRLSLELGRRKRFIADVAHELRTPLAVVALRVESLEDQEAREDLRRATARLTHLVAQMLDLERLSLSGGERGPVDLRAAARDVVADMAPVAIHAGYDLSLEAPESAVIVTGDEHAVARAITNLVANSIAHGGGAGQIRVTVRADGIVDVTDEGPGVPPALQPHLFEPFARGKMAAEGSGLGLHLTREIMRAHGGQVRLLPSERGATFRLQFPHRDASL